MECILTVPTTVAIDILNYLPLKEIIALSSTCVRLTTVVKFYKKTLHYGMLLVENLLDVGAKLLSMEALSSTGPQLDTSRYFIQHVYWELLGESTSIDKVKETLLAIVLKVGVTRGLTREVLNWTIQDEPYLVQEIFNSTHYEESFHTIHETFPENKNLYRLRDSYADYLESDEKAIPSALIFTLFTEVFCTSISRIDLAMQNIASCNCKSRDCDHNCKHNCIINYLDSFY